MAIGSNQRKQTIFTQSAHTRKKGVKYCGSELSDIEIARFNVQWWRYGSQQRAGCGGRSRGRDGGRCRVAAHRASSRLEIRGVVVSVIIIVVIGGVIAVDDGRVGGRLRLRLFAQEIAAVCRGC